MPAQSIQQKSRLRNAEIDHRVRDLSRRLNGVERSPVRVFFAAELSPLERQKYGLTDWKPSIVQTKGRR